MDALNAIENAYQLLLDFQALISTTDTDNQNVICELDLHHYRRLRC